MDSLEARLGKHLRTLRRLHHLTLDKVAEALGKSKATVSKYENGTVSMDVSTLCRLAALYHVQPDMLLAPLMSSEPQPDRGRAPFGGARQLYVYWIYRFRSRGVERSVMECFGDNGLRMYACVDREYRKESCVAIYSGSMETTDIFTRVLLRNEVNPVDYLFMHIPDTFGVSSSVYVLSSSINSATHVPVSMRMIVSQNPIEDDAWLMRQLQFDREMLTNLKQENMFVLTRSYVKDPLRG